MYPLARKPLSRGEVKNDIRYLKTEHHHHLLGTCSWSKDLILNHLCELEGPLFPPVSLFQCNHPPESQNVLLNLLGVLNPFKQLVKAKPCFAHRWNTHMFVLLHITARNPRASQVAKNPPANAGDMISIPGLERSHGRVNGNPLQDSCLGNPMDRGAWRATVHWSHKESDTTEHSEQGFPGPLRTNHGHRPKTPDPAEGQVFGSQDVFQKPFISLFYIGNNKAKSLNFFLSSDDALVTSPWNVLFCLPEKKSLVLWEHH